MADLNPWAVLVAAVLSFVAAGAWYGALGSRLAALSPAYAGPTRHPGATAAVELVRGLVLATGVAVLVAWTDATGAGSLLGLAGLLFVAFPAVLLTGSVWHERVPPLLAAIHAGDWLVKLVLITLVVGLWR